MLWKYFIQYTSKFGKLSSGTRPGKISFHSNLKERQCQGMFKLPHNCIHSHTSKLMLKILEARLQQYTNCQLPDVQAGFRKGQEPEVTLPTSVGSYPKTREFQKNIYFCLIDYSEAFVWITKLKKTVENSSRDGNTRRTYLPPEKSVCRLRSHS